MRWLCLVALLTGGCERLLALDPLDRTDAARSGDAAAGDATPGGDAAPGLDAAPAIDAPLMPGCPVSYMAVTHGTDTGHYRFMLAETATWAAAESECEMQGRGYAMATHLAVFADDVEASAVQSIHPGVKPWIGLSSIGHMGFNWVTDENTLGYPPLVGDPWEAGAPVNGTSVDCVELAGDAKFTNLTCVTAMPYVCECDAYPADPANF